MSKILSILILLSLSIPAYSLRRSSFERDLESMISIIEKEFLDGKTFTVFDAYTVVPTIKILKSSSTQPNAELINTDEEHMGIGVNKALLKIKDRNAILFALAHELGHAFSWKLLEEIGYAGVSGPATEIIADLGAMWVLNQNGVSFEDIESTVLNWESSDIFDKNQSGDHPPGTERATLVIEAIEKIKKGQSFRTVAKDIIRVHS